MLANTMIRNRWKAIGLAIGGIALTMLACEARLPDEPRMSETPQAEMPASKSNELERMRSSSTSIIDREYPPMLRAAGIGGTVGLRIHVTDRGVADQVSVTRSSGHDALDAAAVRVAKTYQWGNEGPGRTTDYWTATSITFDPDGPPAPNTRSLPRKTKDEVGPHSVSYSKMPELRNREEVMEALKRSYPPALRAAGIGGRALVWVQVFKNGDVGQARIIDTTGHPELDEAGLRVVRVMKFIPAENKGQPVDVWIQLPISFTTE